MQDGQPLTAVECQLGFHQASFGDPGHQWIDRRVSAKHCAPNFPGKNLVRWYRPAILVQSFHNTLSTVYLQQDFPVRSI